MMPSAPPYNAKMLPSRREMTVAWGRQQTKVLTVAVCVLSLTLIGCEGSAAQHAVSPQMRALQSQCLIEIPDCRYDETMKGSYCSSVCYSAQETTTK